MGVESVGGASVQRAPEQQRREVERENERLEEERREIRDEVHIEEREREEPSTYGRDGR